MNKTGDASHTYKDACDSGAEGEGTMSVTRELALRERVEELERRIATRDALVKSQSECIERLRELIRAAFHPESWHYLNLQPGDMGEPTNE